MAKTDILPNSIRRMLAHSKIIEIIVEEGKPGGANNDSIKLRMKDGTIISIDAYSPGYMRVTLE